MVVAVLLIAPSAGHGGRTLPGPPAAWQAQSAASAEADCVLGAVRPLLTESARARVTRVEKGPREMVERMRMAGETTVEVLQGGCAHYGVRIMFASPRQPTGAEMQRPLLERARSLLLRLQQQTPSWVVADMLAIVTRAMGRPYQAGEPLQDSSYPDVTLSVTDAEGPAGSLEVVYSFVL